MMMVVHGLMLQHLQLPTKHEGRVHLTLTLNDYLATLICMDLSKDNYHMAKRKHSFTCHSLHALFPDTLSTQLYHCIYHTLWKLSA